MYSKPTESRVVKLRRKQPDASPLAMTNLPQRASCTYQPSSISCLCSGQPIPARNNFGLDVGSQTSILDILDLSPGGFWLHLFDLQSLLCLSIKVQEVRTSTLNLACRIRALLPPIVNCCKKLRGFNTAYRGNTSHEYFVQEGSQLSSRSAYFQFHVVRFWYHQISWTYME